MKLSTILFATLAVTATASTLDFTCDRDDVAVCCRNRDDDFDRCTRSQHHEPESIADGKQAIVLNGRPAPDAMKDIPSIIAEEEMITRGVANHMMYALVVHFWSRA